MTIDNLISLLRNPETQSNGATILNDIIHEAYDIHLVTCPECGRIHSFIPGQYDHQHTCDCGTIFTQGEAPDLFF